MFEICNKRPLPVVKSARYRGMAFDGCYYFCPVGCEKKVLVLDDCCNLIGCCCTVRNYTCLCYDPKRNCFWAGGEGACGALFRLDRCMQEVDRLDLPCCWDRVQGISYCCTEDSLLVAAGERLWKAQPNGCVHAFASDVKDCPMGVTCLYPQLLYWSLAACRQNVYLVRQNGEEEKVYTLPRDYMLESVQLVGECGNHVRFFALAVKSGCYPYLFTLQVPKSSLGPVAPCCRPFPHSVTACAVATPHAGFGFEQLLGQMEQEEYALPLSPHHDAACCQDWESLCRMPPVWKEGCTPQPPHPPHPPCPPIPPIPPFPPNPNSCEDVLESVALVEAAIAHILNAEGEKLQKAIASTSDVNLLLEVNDSIIQTIVRATHLEQVLYSKLAALEEICKHRPRPPCPPPCPPVPPCPCDSCCPFTPADPNC